MSKPLFLASFADRKFRGSLFRIEQEARALGAFEDIFIFDETNLDKVFWQAHRTFILNNPRLFGYGIWKPHVVLTTLRRLPSNAILLYCDAGCSLNSEGSNRLKQYVDLAVSNPGGLLGFHDGTHPEGAWTKMDLLQKLQFIERRDLDSRQVWSGIFFLVNTASNVRLVEHWAQTMLEYNLVDDSPSRSENDPRFQEHRHDQSVFSILFKQHGGLAIEDETSWPGQWHAMRHYPIHARRWKHFSPASREELDKNNGHWPRVPEKFMQIALTRTFLKYMFYPKQF